MFDAVLRALEGAPPPQARGPVCPRCLDEAAVDLNPVTGVCAECEVGDGQPWPWGRRAE